MGLMDLFWPKVVKTEFNRPDPYPGDGPPVFIPAPMPNPQVDGFVSDGWTWKAPPQIDRSALAAGSGREFMGISITAALPNPTRQALGVPTGGPPGWGTYQVGLLDQTLWGMDYTPGPWWNPVLPLDPRQGYPQPDMSQMYIPTSTGS